MRILAPFSNLLLVVALCLGFLAARVVELDEKAGLQGGEDREHTEIELEMTSRLIDLVLYLLHGFGPDEVGKVEAALTQE